MLSILIPTYNYDCTQLVKDLQLQAERSGIDYEIIVADDASPIQAYKEKNRAINALPHCRLIELEENIGRARIRNRLADEAQHEWLLFMDADAEVISNSFIADYLKHTDADVVCGGLCHAETLPSPEVSLRYAYEKRADKKRVAHYRVQRPYEQFTPFNFKIRRTIFQDILLDRGIYAVHLRKPDSDINECRRLLEELTAEQRSHIVVHDYPELYSEFSLKGIHINSNVPSLPSDYNGFKSRSCHSFAEIERYKDEYDYLFLSPIFDSISKPGYRSQFSDEELRIASVQGIIDDKVIALGGVTFDKLPYLESLNFCGVAMIGDLYKL